MSGFMRGFTNQFKDIWCQICSADKEHFGELCALMVIIITCAILVGYFIAGFMYVVLEVLL